MQLPKIFLLASTFLFVGLCFAQPAEPPKTKTPEEMMQYFARRQKERKEKAINDFQKQLRDQYKVSDEAINSLQLLMNREETQLQLVRAALYQVTLAGDPDTKTSDEEYVLFWSDFQTLLSRYRAQRTKDAAQLTQQLDLEHNVRLKAFLSMRGVIGDELSLIKPPSQQIVDSELLSFHLKQEMTDKPKRVVPDVKPQLQNAK